MGHQFGGDHTFNGHMSSCNGNRNASTAFEPGSGSTIQAYAGICTTDNLQANSDPYFHSISFDQIVSYTTVGAGNVPTPVITGNSVPSVGAGDVYVIPKLTPFALTASGQDPDGDSVTFCWEQRDLGPEAALQAPDDGRIPLFRSLPPVPHSTRTFPRLSDVLNNSATPGEQLPSRSRTMRFRVTVRDNRSGGGGVNTDDTQLQVTSSAGPFRVTSPSSDAAQSGFLVVTWDVANTDQVPVNAKFVNILLSTNGGQDFSTTLAANTPNDGSQIVALPNEATSLARIKVAAVGNVFFAVNAVNFRIERNRATVFAVRHAEKAIGNDPPLTSAGQARALTLAELLATSQTDTAFSTNTNRTMSTAAPTANLLGLTVEDYTTVAELAGELSSFEGGRRALVVGHSNTVPDTLERLGVNDTITIGESEFDKLFIVVRTENGTLFHRFRYTTGEAGLKTASPRPQPPAPRPGLRRTSPRSDVQNLEARLLRIERQLQELLRRTQPAAERRPRPPGEGAGG